MPADEKEKKLSDLERDQKRSSANLQTVRDSVRILTDRVSSMERMDAHHSAGIRAGSESDAKLASDQQGMARSLQETQNLARMALATARSIEGKTKAIMLETEDQTTILRKKPTWTISATVVNILCALIYLAIEVLKWMETHH